MQMFIAIASDHGGFRMKGELARLLTSMGHTCHDLGPREGDSVYYPDYEQLVATAVADGLYDRGILICGTGQGMAMSANKVKGIRAALCQDTYSAKMSREHNDASVLCMGVRVLGPGLAAETVKAWLEAEFSEEDRHGRRVAKIRAPEDR
jgi:ribose 5-phosphate isomerase B